jgi:hypothetical protein
MLPTTKIKKSRTDPPTPDTGIPTRLAMDIRYFASNGLMYTVPTNKTLNVRSIEYQP